MKDKAGTADIEPLIGLITPIDCRDSRLSGRATFAYDLSDEKNKESKGFF